MKVKFIVALLLIQILLLIMPLYSQTPQLLNYQGKLNNKNGTAASGVFPIVFAIYADSSGGIALWDETQDVTAKNGVFNVLLGSVRPFTASLFSSSEARYLGIKVGTDPEMKPRFLLTSVPYSIRASEADNTLHFVSNPQNIRFVCSGPEKKIDISPPDNIPAGATAILVTITTFSDARSDHVVHTFGRNANHEGHVYDNRVYDLNAYLNDVMITHEGEMAGSYYYGHSHGSQIIPLKSNGKFDALLCAGYSGGNHYITLQVYGYVK